MSCAISLLEVLLIMAALDSLPGPLAMSRSVAACRGMHLDGSSCDTSFAVSAASLCESVGETIRWEDLRRQADWRSQNVRRVWERVSS